eukprot:Phypoly_transcript_06090.p1 GENE.Phypoly_transcript_06090~~Phypoly_transcript_06090.p1  ORF type:complete len:579 (+),score=89.06 Phypoly_transcript_06090:90-1826(+)
MRLKIVLNAPSYAQTANIPCEGTDTVAQLKQKLKKRIPQVPADIELIFDGGKLFDEDTLDSLGIKEGDSIYEDNGNAGQAPPSSTDVTVGSLSISDGTSSAAAAPPPSDTKPTPKDPNANNNNDSDQPVIVNPMRPITEVLEVVFDISASMDANFVEFIGGDFPQSSLSRLSSSKVCFGAFIDKTLAFEFPHAVGLICFGQNIYDTLPITRQLNTFETVFGDVIKTEGATNLYPAVDLAVKRLQAYASGMPDVKKRIMCFTDGGDNSGWSAFNVAKTVLEAGIVVDAVIVGGSDNDHINLRSLAHCSGGISVRIPEQEASLVSVFEREQILSLSERVPKPILDKDKLTLEAFKPYGDLTLYPYVGVDLKEVNPQAAPRPTVVSKAATLASLQALAAAPAPSSTTSGSTTSSSSSAPATNPAATKRLLKEFQAVQSAGMEVYLADSNISEWKLLLVGPKDTSYEGGIWVVTFSFPSDYPFRPPRVLFITPIYHCNISDQGRVCLDILQNHWSPNLTVEKVMQSLTALLQEPNPDDALDAWKASIARTDRPRYEQEIKNHTKAHACASEDDARQRYNLAV